MAEPSPALLTELLRAHLDPSAECLTLVRGAAGNGQETWYLEATSRGTPLSLVLRRTAAGGTMAYTDRAREVATQAMAASGGLPVPAIRWAELEDSALGRPYFVMDRLPGSAPGREAPAIRAVIARNLGAGLARVHALGPAGVSASAATSTELGAWRTRYLELQAPPVPLLSALFAWLEVNQPELGGEAVVCWGDPGPHNLLVQDGEITAMLDWEMTHPGHPYDDLAVAVWSCLGVLDPELVVTGYEEVSGARVDRVLLDYFETLAGVSRAVAMLMGVCDYRSGLIDSPATAGLGLELFSASLRRAALSAGWEEPEPPSLPASEPAQPGLLPSPADTARGVARLLRGELLAGAGDSRQRRQLKNAAALLDTSAIRLESEPGLAAWRASEAARVSAVLTAGGVLFANLDEAAIAVEGEPAHSSLRPVLRRHLLQDLAAERAALEPLRALYGPSATAARRRQPH